MKTLINKIKKWFHTKDGEEQNEINKQLVIIVVSVVVTVISVMGVTYSAFVWSDNSVKNQNLVVGNIELTINSTSQTLGSELNRPTPSSQEDSLTPYTFTITNTGKLPSKYKIKIAEETQSSTGEVYTNNLDKQYIYMSLDGGASISRCPLQNYEDVAIDIGVLQSGESKTYNLRLWIVENAPNSVIGKEWHGKIVLESSQTVEYANSFSKSQEPILTNTVENKIIGNLKIYGNSVQDGTPTPDNPVEIQSVGDLVTDTSDPNYGKYKIGVVASNDTNQNVTNIYLNEPLRKVGDYADYIDFQRGKVVRNVNELVFNGSEEWAESGYNNDFSIDYMQFWLNGYRNVIGSYDCLCDKFECLVTTQWDNLYLEKEFLLITTAKDFGIRLSKSTVTNLTDFSKWLSENNIKVYYILATPTEENIILPDIKTLNGTTIITANSTIKPFFEGNY